MNDRKVGIQLLTHESLERIAYLESRVNKLEELVLALAHTHLAMDSFIEWQCATIPASLVIKAREILTQTIVGVDNRDIC